MCRIILLWGDFKDDFPTIFRSLSDVATEDPLHPKNGDKGFSHKDGWGFLNLNKEKIVLNKYSSPLTRSTEPPSIFNGVLMVHVRAAAPNEGVGVLNNHPFHVSDDKYDAYIVHNGWFDKYKINESIGYEHPELVNDTEVFINFVMSFKGDMQKRLSEALENAKQKKYLKGGANIFVLAIDRETLNVTIFYHADVASEKEFQEYNKLYAIRGKKWDGIVSSSLIYSSFFPKNLAPIEIERGKLYTKQLEFQIEDF
ncbi:MAG: hypothetical protein QXP36_13310 [Conexivisphaerales archaeon]